MKTKIIFCVVAFLLASSTVFAQKLTFGIENGINYSNIHKKLDYDRFAAQPGPVNGIFAKYELGNWFILQSGLSHVSINFKESEYHYYYDYLMNPSSSYYPVSLLSSCIVPPSYSYLATNKYSFLRIPLLIKYRIPGRFNFEIGGGYYYSFMTNDEFRGKDKDRFEKEYREDNFPDMTDWGLILASSVGYTINKKWSIFASGQITYGREEYFENVEGKMGTTELTFGVAYKPYQKLNVFNNNDSLGCRIQILPHSGLNISRVKSTKNNSEYSSTLGYSAGISLKYKLGGDASIVTGAWYDRKGYTLDYNGYHSALFHQTGEVSLNHVKSNVHLDYLTIPFMLHLSFGERIKSGIEFGAYFSLLQNAFAQGERINRYEHDQGYRINKNYFNESLDLWFKNTDAGIMLAYRIEVPVFSWADVFASVNQTFGVKNILEDSGEAKDTYSFIAEQELKNRSTAIHFGLTIPINKN